MPKGISLKTSFHHSLPRRKGLLEERELVVGVVGHLGLMTHWAVPLCLQEPYKPVK